MGNLLEVQGRKGLLSYPEIEKAPCMWCFTCVCDDSLAASGRRKGPAVLSQNPALWTASRPWLQVPWGLQNRSTVWKQHPVKRPGSGYWLHHLQLNDPGKNLNHPWSLCLICKKNACAFVFVKALAYLQTAGFRDPVYQQHPHNLSLP